LSTCLLLRRAANFADLLYADADDPAFAAPRRSELIGRPLGSEQFVADIERELGRKVRPGKREPNSPGDPIPCEDRADSSL
jgi:hypothetical protein